jgi:hypothetical protein
MVARSAVPLDSPMPLFTFDFAPPGASGSALIDKKTIQTFKNEQHLLIRAKISAGQHFFKLFLDAPATNTFMIDNEDFRYCRG